MTPVMKRYGRNGGVIYDSSKIRFSSIFGLTGVIRDSSTGVIYDSAKIKFYGGSPLHCCHLSLYRYMFLFRVDFPHNTFSMNPCSIKASISPYSLL